MRKDNDILGSLSNAHDKNFWIPKRDEEKCEILRWNKSETRYMNAKRIRLHESSRGSTYDISIRERHSRMSKHKISRSFKSAKGLMFFYSNTLCFIYSRTPVRTSPVLLNINWSRLWCLYFINRNNISRC